VFLHGLNADKLNGLEGTLEMFVDASSRWRVKLDSEHEKALDVRPTNITSLNDPIDHKWYGHVVDIPCLYDDPHEYITIPESVALQLTKGQRQEDFKFVANGKTMNFQPARMHQLERIGNGWGLMTKEAFFFNVDAAVGYWQDKNVLQNLPYSNDVPFLYLGAPSLVTEKPRLLESG